MYDAAWFEQLQYLIDTGQIFVKVRNIDNFELQWAANVVEVDAGGPLIIKVDLGKPPHREQDKRRRD